jgi:hypothetical protein
MTAIKNFEVVVGIGADASIVILETAVYTKC